MWKFNEYQFIRTVVGSALGTMAFAGLSYIIHDLDPRGITWQIIGFISTSVIVYRLTKFVLGE